ncbi:MAG: dephospho-CoA kinase [Nitrospiria bacterium]
MSIIKVGLTGGIASGKTTLAKMFKSLGAEIIDADKIARRVVKKGLPAYQKIVKTFGDQCLNKKGEINRSYLGKIVFADPEKRKRLNDIVHPEVFKIEKKEENKIRKRNPKAVILYDIPLLIETGSHLKMDRVILVHVRRKVQIERLRRRNRLTPEESLKRIRAQISFKQKKRAADYLINGEGKRSEIFKKVKQCYEEITRKYKL